MSYLPPSSVVAVVIPFDVANRNYMIVRSTNWHPVPSFRHKLKGIGGVVDEEEEPETAVRRELAEEQPGWFLRIPGASMIWGGKGTPGGGGMRFAGTVTGAEVVWHVFVVPTDLGLRSFRAARASATESTPEVWSLGVVPPEEQCLPGFRGVIEMALRVIDEVVGRP